MHTMSEPDHILAGVRACSLATRVLEIKFSDPEAPSTQAVTQLALQVLESWGLKITTTPKSEVAKPAEGKPEPAAPRDPMPDPRSP